MVFNFLSANPTKRSNTQKQFIRCCVKLILMNNLLLNVSLCSILKRHDRHTTAKNKNLKKFVFLDYLIPSFWIMHNVV